MNKKENEHIYCLYINLTSNYTSFKIEEGKYLGKLDNGKFDFEVHVVEHNDDEVNYLKIDDIHKTEKEAFKALIKILQNKVKK